jgi:hypothetical protein
MKLVVAALASVALFAAAPTDAFACSCLPWGNAKEELAKAKGAFVGVYLGRRPTTKWPGAALYRFRVERRLKGSIGRTVEVVSANNGAACGLEVQKGHRYGLLLRRVRGRWHSSLCEQRSARFFRGLPSRRLAGCTTPG